MEDGGQFSDSTGHNWSFGLLGDYLRWFEAIRCGEGPSDKIRILLNRLLHATYPLNSLSYRMFGRPLFEPRRLIDSYRCKYGGLIFDCPGGNTEIQFLKHYEPAVKQTISQIRQGQVVDVGASFGLYTLVLSRALSDSGKVVSIEPDLSYFRFLTKNLRLNECRNVVPLNIAAWSTKTKLKMTRHVFGGPITDSMSGSSGETVDARPLDEVFSEIGFQPSFVKIDAEGAEYEVMLGMQKALKDHRPAVVFESLNSLALAKCSSLLSALKYEIGPLSDGNILAVSRYQADGNMSDPHGS